MRLLHYSAQPLGTIHSVEQADSGNCGRGFKPRGLWVSVEGEDDWASWCKSEQFALENLTHAHEISLAPDAKILRLSTPDDIDRLTRAFPARLSGITSVSGIRWDEIARDYHGIIIAPYVWERRLDPAASWYYPWDCASGCIWDAASVADARLLSEVSHDC
jgi:hypothetical protein